MAKEIISECEYCGYKTRDKASKCPLCGASLKSIERVIADTYNQESTINNTNANPSETYKPKSNPNSSRSYYVQKSGKSRIVASMFAFFAGNLGLHKFYMGNITAGILYILFWWTSIPSILSIIDGIRYLCMTDEQFQSLLVNK